ncbi:head-tail adaptor protein [Palleronia caenipelagi]|nr:head-tail adaptor protein [Palleronia caenipelagi]
MAPQLTRALILEDRVAVADGAGGTVTEWQPLGQLWAEMVPASAGTSSGPARHTTRVTWRITLRATPYAAPSRPQAGQRFREGERLYAIQAVHEDGPSGRWLTCIAEEERAP